MSEEIWKHLDDLHGQLEGVPEADELRETVAGYRADPDEHPDFTDRLRESATSLEASHPELSHFISGVIDLLTAAGI